MRKSEGHGQEMDGGGVRGGAGAGLCDRYEANNCKLEKALKAYFEGHNECLFPTALRFPYEVSTGSNTKPEEQRLEAMTGAGLLSKQTEEAIKVERYPLTPLG